MSAAAGIPVAGRRVGWADVACVGGIALSLVWYLALIPAIPSLIGTHPLLLEALNGSLPSMVAAGAFARIGRAPLVLALIAPVTGMAAFDPLWWWAGRRYGTAATQFLASQGGRTQRSTKRAMRLFDRYGGWTVVFAYYLPVPNNVLYAVSGWAGFSLLRFVVLDLIGTLLNSGLDVGLGYALGGNAAHAARLVSRYSIAATVTLIAGMLLVGWWRHRPGRAGAQPVTVDAGWQAGLATSLAAAPPRDMALPEPASLRALIADGAVPGLVYAVITPDGRATGQLARTGSQPLGPHLWLEIGSVTKVFTALLLADMAGRGEAGLDDPIARHLPAEVARACPAAARITLRQLATHTSGLPRLPPNLLPSLLRHPADPYASYSTAQLYRALRRAKGGAPAPYQYSNYGFGLLGHLLSRTAGQSYPQLIAERVTGPLGLTETGVAVPDGRLAAAGHRGGRPAAPWHLDALAGAGALRSTAADLARFLHANLHPEATPLRPAIEAIQCPHPGAPGDQVTGLGWHLTRPPGRPVLWHNGGTGGFSAMIALDRAAGCAVGAVATAAPTRGQPLDGAVVAALSELTA